MIILVAARAKHGLGPWWPFMATVAVGLVLLAAGLCLLSFRSFWGYLRARQMLTYD